MKTFNLFILLAFLTISLYSQTLPAIQSSAVDTTIASQYFQEATVVCKRDGGKLWGVSLCAPMVFVDRETRQVVANRAVKKGILMKDGDVFVGKLPLNINIANTAFEWAGVKWTMVVFPLPKDTARRTSLMAHEAWHRIQSDIGFPSSGAANNHLDSRDGRIWLQLEWRALAAALMSKGKNRRQAIEDALLFRAHRRTIFSNAASEEREMEMHEGLAEYTGVKLCGGQNLDQLVVDNNLREAANKETFVRSFAYASGPAYGVLLDESKAKWRKNLKKEDDLGNLLQKKLALTLPQNIKDAAELRAKYYDGDKLQASETERESNRQKVLAEYRAKLIDGAILVVPILKMNMQMNPGTLVPLEPVGTVYPDIRIVDAWGILTVTKGALIKSDFSGIHVSAPTNLSSSPLQGDGWTLELNPGWKIEHGERTGDYILRSN